MAGLLVAAAMLAGCTDDRGWAVDPDPRSPRAIPTGGSLALVALKGVAERGDGGCQSDLENIQKIRRASLEEFQRQQRNFGNEADSADARSDAALVGPTADQAAGAKSEPAARSAAPEATGNQATPPQPTGRETDATEATKSDDVVGTNLQEAGVDEADVIKTDGRVIVVASAGILRTVKIDDDPQIDGTLDVSSAGVDGPTDAAQMYLIGDTVFLVGSTYGSIGRNQTFGGDVTVDDSAAAESLALPETRRSGRWADDAQSDFAGDFAPEPGAARTVLTQVDISDPSQPKLVRSESVDGALVSSRAVGATVHVVTTSYSSDVLPSAIDSMGTRTTLGSCEDVLVETMLDSTGKPLAPSADASTGDPSTSNSSAEVEPDVAPSMLPPAELVTVLSFDDLAKGIHPTVIEGSGGVIYGSPDSIYVASPMWTGNFEATAIHRFALDAKGPAKYVATGTVSGALLDQYSMSEFESALRVVTTGTTASERASSGEDQPIAVEEAPPTAAETTSRGEAGSSALIKPAPTGTVEPMPAPAVEPMPDVTIEPMPAPQPPAQRSTKLTTLNVGDMKPLGLVDGLAPGESVKSSRFIGPMAYVVTFRQTDPLFAIDVGDPRSPRVLGELKIPGFSEYLHPVGQDLLLGVGRNVDPTTARDLGLKLSLFDVSNPSEPKELDTWTLDDAYSPVAQDPHAFTWDSRRNRALLPVEGLCARPTQPGNDMAALVNCGALKAFQVSDGKITETADIVHPYDSNQGADPGGEMPLRSAIAGSRLWTLSRLGLGFSTLEDPSAVSLLRFG